MAGPDIDFWKHRFEQRDTPWDRGAPSPQLQAWLASGALSAATLNGTIAVPGCGSGHEVVALAEHGFRVIGIDYTDTALALAQARAKNAGVTVELVQADVLRWTPPQPLAAVYEQTCLCALHPDHWQAYAAQLHAWIRPGGRLFALFMQARREGANDGLVEGPPYHSDINAMRALFSEPHWSWPAPPYARVPHSTDRAELAVLLERR